MIGLSTGRCCAVTKLPQVRCNPVIVGRTCSIKRNFHSYSCNLFNSCFSFRQKNVLIKGQGICRFAHTCITIYINCFYLIVVILCRCKKSICVSCLCCLCYKLIFSIQSIASVNSETCKICLIFRCP